MVRARRRCVGNSGVHKVEATCHRGDSSPQARKDPRRPKEFQGKLSHSSPPITRSCSSSHVTIKNCGTGTQEVTNVSGGVTLFPSPKPITIQESGPDDEVEIVAIISRQSPKTKTVFNSLQSRRFQSSTKVIDFKSVGPSPEPKSEVVFIKEESLYFVDQNILLETRSSYKPKLELGVPLFKTENGLDNQVLGEVLTLPEGLDKVESEVEIETSTEPDESVGPASSIFGMEKLLCQTPHKIQICYEGSLPQSPSSALSSLDALSITQTPKKTARCSRKLHPSQVSNQQAAHSSPRPKQAEIIKQVIAKNHKIDEYYPIVRRSNRKTKQTIFEEKQLELEQAIKEEREDGLEVHNFEGKGRGVVTTRAFSRGEFVVEYSGELIDLGEAKLRETIYTQDQNTGCYMYYFKYRNHQFCIDATSESGRLGRLVNHSRTNGNLITKTVAVGSKPHLVLLAKEDIQVGEEIMYDYGDRSKESLRFHPWLNC